MILKTENLNIYYGNIHAVKDLNIHINKGEIVSLLGANGAGKTTILQTISGIIRAKSGNIIFNDKSIVKKRAHLILKSGIAHVPEGRRVFSSLCVNDNIILGEYSVKDSIANKIKYRERFYSKFPRMKERKNQLAGTLSGGEQQMLAMGRALMSRPKLILLDEPSMGLAPLFVKEIFDVILQLRDEGTTILLVEQNANMALNISDRAYILETGKVILEGDAKILKDNNEIKKAYLGG